jgi:hypothetical protein
MPYDPGSPTCSYECKETEPSLARGSFSYQQLTSPWQVRGGGSMANTQA